MRQHQEQRAQQQLVGDGIQIGSEFCPLTEQPRQGAIESVADAGHHHQNKCAMIMTIQNREDKEGHDGEPKQRQLIRQST